LRKMLKTDNATGTNNNDQKNFKPFVQINNFLVKTDKN
jgi:hypothetical protein